MSTGYKNLTDADFLAVADDFLTTYERYSSALNVVCITEKNDRSSKAVISLKDAVRVAETELNDLKNQTLIARSRNEILAGQYALSRQEVTHKTRSFYRTSECLYHYRNRLEIMNEHVIFLK